MQGLVGMTQAAQTGLSGMTRTSVIGIARGVMGIAEVGSENPYSGICE